MSFITNKINTFFNKKKIDRYKKRLVAVLNRLHSPNYIGHIEPEDRLCKIQTIEWLLDYYNNEAQVASEGNPKEKLNNILRKPSSEFDELDHIRIKILMDWINHKRIEGF